MRYRKKFLKILTLSAFVVATLPMLSPLTSIVGNSKGVSLNQFSAEISWLGQAKASENNKTKWTCPMHPHYIADEAGTCPICGMNLVKLETKEKVPSTSSVASRSQVTISPQIIQNIGVRIAKAESSLFGRKIRSYGIVHENERTQTEISARLEGWVEDLKVTAVGDDVTKGMVLFTLFAPELIVSQRDFLTTKGTVRRRNVKKRLLSFGVQKQFIDELIRTEQVMDNVPFYADRDGTMSELHLKQGTYVKRGMMLAKIQDYSKVWLIAGVAETDLSFISKGTTASVKFPNVPGKEVIAKVDYIYPTIDSKTRTGKVRFVIDNKDGKIPPGTYADVEFQVEIKRRLSIPSEAILKSGSGKYVVVSLGQGQFEPRPIKVGLTSGNRTEITDGVKVGEDVVVSGQFLLDSESALREAFRKLERVQSPLGLLKLDKTQMSMIDHIVDAALYIHEALVNGNDIEPKQLEPAVQMKDVLLESFKNTKLEFVLQDGEKALRQAQTAKTVSELRASLGKLVKALKPWMSEGAPQHYRNRKVVMFHDPESNHMWLQLAGIEANPYSTSPGHRIAWPEAPNIQKTSEKNPTLNSKKEMSSSQNMRGSHAH